MKIILLLLIVSLTVSVVFLLLYILSSKNGQFDDTYSPGQRVLFDDKTKFQNNKR